MNLQYAQSWVKTTKIHFFSSTNEHKIAMIDINTEIIDIISTDATIFEL